MIPITIESVEKAAKKSKQAALENGIKKYAYFITCNYSEFLQIHEYELQSNYCALCKRYYERRGWKCPLGEGYCKTEDVLCKYNEWSKLANARTAHEYEKFQLYASAILVKLLKLAGKLK